MVAQVNQPLIHHPLNTLLGYKSVGYLPVLKKTITNEDRLLIEAPAASPNGAVARLLSTSRPVGIKIEVAGAPLGAGNVRLVLKLADGREAVLFSNPGGEVQGQVIFAVPNESFPLTDVGSGIYLRVVAGIEVDAFADTFDIRAETTAFDLSDVAHIENGPGPGEVIVPVNNLNLACGILVNFDSITHGYVLEVSDGVNTLGVTAPDPTLGIGAFVRAPTAAFPLGEGWTASLRLTEAVVTSAPRLFMTQQRTNLSPVRSNQGGAY